MIIYLYSTIRIIRMTALTDVMKTKNKHCPTFSALFTSSLQNIEIHHTKIFYILFFMNCIFMFFNLNHLIINLLYSFCCISITVACSKLNRWWKFSKCSDRAVFGLGRLSGLTLFYYCFQIPACLLYVYISVSRARNFMYI